jgi:hypothetical protein
VGKLAEALGVTVEELWPGFNTGWRSGLMSDGVERHANGSERKNSCLFL